MDDVIVSMKHIRAMGYCSGGARLFCENHGIDWDLFLAQGISASELSKLQDAQIDRLIEVACGQEI